MADENVRGGASSSADYIYEDLMRHLEDPDYLQITTTYNVRGGIHTTCTVNSRKQAH